MKDAARMMVESPIQNEAFALWDGSQDLTPALRSLLKETYESLDHYYHFLCEAHAVHTQVGDPDILRTLLNRHTTETKTLTQVLDQLRAMRFVLHELDPKLLEPLRQLAQSIERQARLNNGLLEVGMHIDRMLMRATAPPDSSCGTVSWTPPCYAQNASRPVIAGQARSLNMSTLV